ncbi:MAG: lamin tail domain-containing protein [Verrucomicrobiaceae bacterium]
MALTKATLAFDSIVVINEIQYHPEGDDAALEFLELYNQNTVNVDLSGWRISGGVDFVFPEGTILDGQSYLVIAAAPATLEDASGIDGAYGPWEGALENKGETLRLRNGNDRIMDEVEYNDRFPWPVAADGSGASLSKLRPDTTGVLVANWHFSLENGGTPGAPNFIDPSSVTPGLRISEVSAAGANFSIELLHTGTNPLNLANHILATSGNPGNEYTFPGPLDILQPGERRVIESAELGFTPPATERLFLLGKDRETVLDGVDLKTSAQARDFTGQSDEFLQPNSLTPNAENDITYRDEIVINEIMYSHRPQYASEGVQPSFAEQAIFDFNKTWRFNDSGNDLGTGWADSSHVVGGDWKSGPAPIGRESADDIDPPIATAATVNFFSNYISTYYFETDFDINAQDLAGITQLKLTHMIDDGAVFYLNGQEIGRVNLPEGVITYETRALENIEADQQTLIINPTNLLAGNNRFSIEVHQTEGSSSDIVMALALSTLEEIPSDDPPRDYEVIEEEWIELYNRSQDSVDLGGWKIEDAVDFEFPQGTQLGSGEYLVVAKDAAALASKFSGITILGDFSGSLSNSRENVRLSDARGNPADEVYYHDGSPWPGAADAGGSSIELLNPEIDNAKASSWAASSNAATSEWKNYSYTATAALPHYRPNILNFHELRLGLLEGGEVLLDDVSVLENPTTAPRELMQNGGFNNGSDSWRLLGTHQHSSVIDDDGNAVLKVVATGSMNYLNNLLETSLKADGNLVPVVPGTEYRISFRAKWLKGSPQFRAELYYNQLAELFILEQPETHGTPGSQNSTFVTNPGPQGSRLKHDPAVPDSNQAITVSAHLSDPDGISSATLHYSVNGSSFQQVTMAESGISDIWTGQIPGQSTAARIQFYLEMTDGAAQPVTAFHPPAGPDSRAMVQVKDNRASTVRQNIRVILPSSDSNAMHNAADLLSNDRYPCTVIVNEQDIHYDCGIRLRGSMWSRRTSTNTGFNIKFPADNRFRGIHKTMTVRNRGRQEIVVKHLINQAGELHDNYNDAAQLIYNTQNGVPVRVEMARFGTAYMKGHKNGGGTVFKMEGIRQFESTSGNNPEGQKLPFPIGWVSSFDLADQGDEKEIYRHNMRINSNNDIDDYTEIIRMCKTFSLSGQEIENAAIDNLNVDEWMRQFALLSLCGISDTYTQGNPHNLNFYVRPQDGKVEPMPWDWDFTFQRSTNSSLWGGRNFAKLPGRSIFQRLYHGHLHDMINSSFDSAYMQPWLTHYGSKMGENYSSTANYITARSNYVLSQLPTETPFAINTNGGSDFDVAASTVNLSGNGWIDVREIIVNGSPDPFPVIWTDASTWEIQIPIQPGANPLTLTALDFQGNATGSDTINVTNTSTTEPASAANLVISELHYHPTNDALEEFVELQNIHPTASVDLTGVLFTEGIDFEFPSGTILAPGERILVVQNLAAFSAKYGNQFTIVGAFGNLTKLSNKGETIRLEAQGGELIQEVTYSDEGSWPDEADGKGPSLVLIYPSGNPDHALAVNWRPSIAPGGNPGTTDAVSFTGIASTDSDNDGYNDLLEYALGSDPTQTSSTPQISLTPGAGNTMTMSVNVQANADDIIVAPQFSSDLNLWTVTGLLTSRVSQGNGIDALTFRFEFASPATKGFTRILVEQR